jgi:hypothetical protein
MIAFYIQLIVIVAIVTAGLCVAVWRLAKAGGGVKVGFIVKVDWGGKQ